MEREFTTVTCYSGGSYADRPTLIRWRDADLAVTSIETVWREPGRKHFRVRTEDGRLFELCYHEDTDRWTAMEVVSGSQKGGRDEQRGS